MTEDAIPKPAKPSRHIALSVDVWKKIAARREKSLRTWGAEVEFLLRRALKDIEND